MRDSRGQLILVGAVAVAVVFVALALVFNTAIYTSTLATQQSGGDGSEPLAYQDTAIEGVGGIVYYANYYNYSGYETLTGTTESQTRNWSHNATRHSVASRTATVTHVTSVTNGTQIFQNKNETFKNAKGEKNWKLASGIKGTRRFSIQVERGTLHERDVVDSILDVLDETYSIQVTNGDKTRYIFIYNESTGDDIVVQVENQSGLIGRCYDESGRAVVDISQGRVGGESCSALTFPGIDPPYKITYNNSQSIQGQYSLVIDKGVSGVPSSSYNSLVSRNPPYAVAAVYSATVEVTYESADLRYTTNRTVTLPTPPQGHSFTVWMPPIPRRLVYVEDGAGLRTVAPGGVPTEYPAGSASNLYALGMFRYSLDGDNYTEIAYVNSSTEDSLMLIDETGETQELAPDVFKDGIAVNTWEDRGLSGAWVFYSNRNDNKYIYRARMRSGSVKAELVKSTPASSIAGVANFEPDSDNELVYLGTSKTVHYLDSNGTVVETGYSVGSNKEVAGQPADFNGDGLARMPFVDGSGHVALVNYDKDKTAYATNATKAGTTSANVDDDPRPEIVYLDNNDRLAYVDFYRENGDLKWDAHPLMADIDGDGDLERVKVREASGVA